jgi:nucleoid-associated protein YgaU
VQATEEAVRTGTVVFIADTPGMRLTVSPARVLTMSANRADNRPYETTFSADRCGALGVPAPASVAPAPVAPVSPAAVAGGRGTHVVQRGENLFRIALGYGLTTEELAAANNIADPTRIFAGQVLVIP